MLKLKLKRIAITGALGCGKTSACRFFREFSAYVVSADHIVHQLLQNDAGTINKVIELFGPDIVTCDNNGKSSIDRAKIAKKAFQQPLLLQALEQLLHPAVYDEIAKQYQQASADPSVTLFIAEIPLLFETGAEKHFDATIAVLAPLQDCIARFSSATGYDENEYHRRMARQLSSEEKAAKATYTLHNEGTLADFKTAVKKLYQKLI